MQSGRRAQGVPAELVAFEVPLETIRAGARTYRELARRYRDELTTTEAP